MTLQALIFDIDGALAETEEAHRAAFNAAFEEFGLPWRWDAALYKELLQIAGGGQRLRHYMQTWAPETLIGDGKEDLPERVHRHKTGLYFEVFTAGDTVENAKPAPDIYQWVLGELGLAAENCLVFEDSHIGLTAARGAGLRVVVTPTQYTHDEDFAGALRVLDSLAGVDPLALAEWLAE